MTHWPNSFAGSDVANRRTNFSGLKFKEDAETVPSTSSILCNESLECAEEADVSAQNFDVGSPSVVAENVSAKSRLFAYIDLHGHASKRGNFLDRILHHRLLESLNPPIQASSFTEIISRMPKDRLTVYCYLS